MKNQLSTIQSLRALAALSVVAYHVKTIGVGLFGVDIFFVISGFIICYVAERNPDGFILHRIVRVVPLYWLATLAVFTMSLWAARLLQTQDRSVVHLLESLFFIPYLRPNGLVQPVLFLGWTLNYEMFFYVVFWFSLSYFGKCAPWITALILCLVVVITQIVQPSLPWSFWGDWRLLEFTGGIAAFLFYRTDAGWLHRIPKNVLVGIFVTMLAVLVVQTRFGEKELNVLICGPVSAVLFIAAIGLEGRVNIHPIWVAIGNASYSLYLLHPYVLRAVEKIVSPATGWSMASLAATFIIFALSVGVALFSYRYFEAPINRAFKDRMRLS